MVNAFFACVFMVNVFPTLPVLSRTDLGLGPENSIPERSILDKIPTHLLAAIYGSALPFASEEDHLLMFMLFEKPSASEIWRIVYRLIMEEIHTPRLSVMQAAILYLHKSKKDDQSYAVADTPFTWSFMGLAVGLAHSLGLQLECGMMGLPAWEKRLRRRLWWALYIEDKFLSMLLGKPPYLRSSEWDVVELSDDDFVIAPRPIVPVANLKLPFRDMARLAVIAEAVQEKLYSLRASQILAHEMALSVETARPIFRSLTTWRESLPLASATGHILHDTVPGTASPYPATIYNAYLILVACVWRAILRTTVKSSEPAQIIHVEDPADATVAFLNDLRWEFHHLPEMDFRLDHGHRENGTMVGELYEASLGCADTLVDFVSNLAAPSFGEFWHSWSRIGFALMSNFLMLLLVQAPDFGKAVEANRLLMKWKQVLDHHHRAFPPFLLAKARLGSYYYVGLDEAFYLPPHVHQALQQG
ncbi:unnamed protein product [Clonostachys chloroleuca]|uniref:Xylanolytic transcriptional activator regulatory domain-containing protein n=1 Tax=Clonostachys chloroleuca TaxID=1926264 RepID=A0AA35LTZ0_9HYPO|nr:unnamed protein product [Clonostachys chloroleuca]